LRVVSRLFTDEDVTGGAEGGECAAGRVSVPHPPVGEPRSKWSGVPQRLPPSDSLGRGVRLVGHAISPIYTAFRGIQDLPG
jgi:hypothetical protein